MRIARRTILKKAPKVKRRKAEQKDVSELEYTTKPVMGVVPVEPTYDQLKVTLVNTPAKVESLLKKLSAHDGMVGFDTEAVGPQLRGVDFINITYACLLGISLAFEGSKRAYYIPVRHKGNNIDFGSLDDICAELQRLAAEQRLVAHNAKFDHQIMMKEGYALPGTLDSMILAWWITGRNYNIGLKYLAEHVLERKSPPYDPAMGSKTGDQIKQYAGHDAMNALELFLRWQDSAVDWYRNEECYFAYVLADMKLTGFPLDTKRLAKVRERAVEEMYRIHKEWSALAPDVKIGSSKDLQELFTDGTWAPKGRTRGGAFSTSVGAMEHNKDHAPTETGRQLAQLRLDYQEVAKIVNTYTTGLIEESRQWADGKLHADLFHFGTVTGRLSCANPNLQNQPAHGSWAAAIRECFVPPPGMRFTAADYSQIELRVFANYCGGKLLRMYQTDADLHAETGEVFARWVKDKKVQRDLGKRTNFGFMLYGGGPDKLVETVLDVAGVTITLEDAQEIIDLLDQKYPDVGGWKRSTIERVGGKVEWDEYGRPQVVGCTSHAPHVETVAGRGRCFLELLPDIFQYEDPEGYAAIKKQYLFNCKKRGKNPSAVGLWMSVRARGERLLINYLIQGGSRDLLVAGMNAYHRTAPEDFKIVMTVHDEVLTQHPKGKDKEAQALLKLCLEGAGRQLGLDVPIVAEPKSGAHWGEVK